MLYELFVAKSLGAKTQPPSRPAAQAPSRPLAHSLFSASAQGEMNHFFLRRLAASAGDSAQAAQQPSHCRTAAQSPSRLAAQPPSRPAAQPPRGSAAQAPSLPAAHQPIHFFLRRPRAK